MSDEKNKQPIPKPQPSNPPSRREHIWEDSQKSTNDKFPSRVQPVDEWPEPDKKKK